MSAAAITVAEAIQKRKELERDLARLIEDFGRETGLTVTGLDLDIVKAGHFDGPEQRFVSVAVSINV